MTVSGSAPRTYPPQLTPSTTLVSLWRGNKDFNLIGFLTFGLDSRNTFQEGKGTTAVGTAVTNRRV
jgi:hypothetical protein